MFMLLYLFSIKSGCRMFIYLQKIFFRKSKVRFEIKPITRHTSIVTFMELNLMMWTCYLVLLFCYDDHFLGERHPVTTLIAAICLAGSIYMFIKLIKIPQWDIPFDMRLPRLSFFGHLWKFWADATCSKRYGCIHSNINMK